MPILNNLTVNEIGGGAGKYSLLQRVTDDSNQEIGTVCGFYKDNNNEYAIVVLDAQYRIASGVLLSSAATTGIEIGPSPDVYKYRNPTYFTQILIDYATANSLTTVATDCRALIFTIDGVQYAGQVPTISNCLDIYAQSAEIDNVDTSISLNPDCALTSGSWSSMGSCIGIYASSKHQYANIVKSTSAVNVVKLLTSTGFFAPVLELPNN